MNVKKIAFYSLFLLCFGFGLFLFNRVDSFAFPSFSYTCVNGNPGFENTFSVVFRNTGNSRLAIYLENPTANRKNLRFYSNQGGYLTFDVVSFPNSTSDVGSFEFFPVSGYSNVYYASVPYSWLALSQSVWSFSTNPQVRVFTELDSLYDYIENGVLPTINYDSSLKLDSFKVNSWNVGNIQALFKSNFVVTWSDSRISFVQVRISGSSNVATFESSSSPYRGRFQADNYVMRNGDVIHLVATPFKSDGSYGESLYYTVTYADNIPFSNTYRKLVNNNVNDNTLTIPYSGTSGNDNVTLPVDGVTTNVTYKVNYNPVTNEYNTQNFYEVYYSPVVVYPEDTTEQEVDDTQTVIVNNYNTNNYYETVKNIDTNFDIDITDVSSGDIQNTYDDIGDFFKGFGGFVGKLALLFNGLFPFLSPTVSVVLVTMVGIIAVGAVVILFLKIFHII